MSTVAMLQNQPVPQTSSRASESPPAHCSLPVSVSPLRFADDSSLSRPPTSCMCNLFGPGHRAPTFCVAGRGLSSFRARKHSWISWSGICSGFVWAKRRPAALVCQRRAEGVKTTPSRVHSSRLWGGKEEVVKGESEVTECSDGKHEDAPRWHIGTSGSRSARQRTRLDPVWWWRGLCEKLFHVNLLSSCPTHVLHCYSLRKDFCCHFLLLWLFKRKLVCYVTLHSDWRHFPFWWELSREDASGLSNLSGHLI